jgi:APA family basic amino acid/polyamine antiporter
MSSPVSGSDVGKVGLATAIAIVVANMIGTGVFGSLGFQVAGIPSGFPILVLWLVGGIVSFCGAVCYAELASIFPKSGGEYHLLSKAWNPFIGFLAGHRKQIGAVDQALIDCSNAVNHRLEALFFAA